MNKIISLFLSLLLIIVFPVNLHAESHSNLDLSFIDDLTEEAMENEIFPGATVLVKQGDDLLYEKSFGHAYLYDMGEKLDNPIPMRNDTLYDLASVTKVAATTQAIMILYDQGKLKLDDPVVKYIPEFGVNGKEHITIIDLLTHTSGLPQWEPSFLYTNTREGSKEYFSNLELLYETGTAMKYSDFSFIGLAFIVEAISKQPIEEFLDQNLYSKLGMKNTMYVPLENGVEKDRIAATSWGNPFEWRMSNEEEYPGYGYDTSKDVEAFKKFDNWREYTLHGEVNDGNAGMANEGVAGHAGLYSTAHDLSILGTMMLQGGEYNGHQIYSPDTIETFTKAYEDRFGRGLGWQVGGASERYGYVGKYADENVFSHAGFTGTQFILDKEYDLQVIILTNKQNLGHDNGNYPSPYAYSRNIMNGIYERLFDEEVVLKSKIKELKTEFLDLNPIEYGVEDYKQTQSLFLEKTVNLDEKKYPELKEIYKILEEELLNLNKLDLSKLNEIEDKVGKVDESLYNQESFERLMEVVKTKPNYWGSQAELDQYVEKLESAYASLEKTQEEPKEEQKEEPKEEIEEEKKVVSKDDTSSLDDQSKTPEEGILPQTGIGHTALYSSLSLVTLGASIYLLDKKKRS